LSEQRKYDTPYVPANNKGTIRPNRFKKQGTQEPDWRGDVQVNGVIMQISAWVMRDKNNNEYFSLKFSPPYQRPGDGPPRQDAQRRDAPMDDDIPW
jgi:hypothetical protein